MDFTALSESDIQRMLSVIGEGSVEELLEKVIPQRYRLTEPLPLPPGLSELELIRLMESMVDENLVASQSHCFLGGGAYDHYIPAPISHIVGRSEYYTEYTPYQAEVSQGTLQTIYEFQSMISHLMGMDVANASHYDGATAVAEGVLMAIKKTGRPVAVIPKNLNPHYQQVIKTYTQSLGIELREVEWDDGRISLNALNQLAQNAGAVVIQHPNFFGLLEPVEKIADIAHQNGALVVSSTYPITLALLKPPGEWGADIGTAEGQPLGVPLSYGGPYVGLLAARKELIRLMPGRIVARTRDLNGKQGYVLTLQTREQHIRREKATSNICTNQALVALINLVYLSLLGPDGLRRVAMNSYRGAHYLASRLAKIEGCQSRFSGEYFNEFALKTTI
ncbi:MAG: aminomethyl-transferring glycine dehydrogenase subunit GcvPA, partial [bacterium]